MFLVNWLVANILMVFVVLVLVGIPVFIGFYAFGKKSRAEADIENYQAEKERELKGEKQETVA